MEIDKIKLDKCLPFKDFGKGFYTTPLKEQALKMAERTVKIKKEGSPYITVFYMDDIRLSSIDFKVKRFLNPDKEWAKFVINNRNRNYKEIKSNNCNTDAKFDIVIGPVANDDIIALIDIFLAGLISDDALAKELTFREINNQISYHTENSLSLLTKKDVYYG